MIEALGCVALTIFIIVGVLLLFGFQFEFEITWKRKGGDDAQD